MLPDYLASSYQQYKSDTNYIATWLATTAKGCGYAPDLMVAEKPVEKSARLKGKARKQAKAAGKGSNPTSKADSSQKGTYIIAIKDFLTMAQHIASYSKASVKMSSTFVRVLDRAIALRKGVGAELESQENNDEGLEAGGQDSDQRHSYFVGVLEGVRETLRPRMPVELLNDRLTQPPNDTKHTPQERMTNLFAKLEVEEPSEAFLEAPDVSPDVSSDEPHYEVEWINDLNEATTAFECLLHDFYTIQQEVQRTWVGYQNGYWDIVTASVTSNTAIELARRLEEDVLHVLDPQGGSQRMLEIFYMAHCLGRGHDPDFKERPDDDLNYAVYDITSEIYWPTQQILQAYLKVLEPKCLPMYRPGTYGIYDPSADRSKMSPREKFKEDKIILCEILPDFSVLALGGRGPAEDEFCRGLKQVFRDRKIPLWVTFAAQVFLDIHHVLRENVDSGFQRLCQIGNAISRSITRNLEFHEKLKIVLWPSSNDQGLRRILSLIQSVCVKDHIYDVRNKVHGLQAAGIPKHQLLKSHPMKCGLEAYNIKTNFHEACIAFANAWGSITFTAHLYNALTREKLLGKRWSDMDLVLTIQDANWLFVGDPPASAENYFRRFCLAMGYSVSNFARNARRRNGPVASAAGPRGLQEKASVTRMFAERFCHGAERTEMTTQDVERILDKSDFVECEDEEGEGLTVIERQPRSERSSHLKSRWKSTGRLKIQQLLHNLNMSLQAEILEFSFDYMLMHRQCWTVLRQVKTECADKMRQVYGPEYLEKENQLPFLVGYIFMAMTNDERLAQQIGLLPKRDGFKLVSRELLESAAKTLNMMLSTRLPGNIWMGELVSLFVQSVCNIRIEAESETEGEEP